jgi:hypothetical protein
MGVDYYECDHCGYGFRDDSEYAAWCECGAHFHSVDCGKLGNYQVIEGADENDPRYDDWINGDHRIDPDKDISCVICRKEVFTDTGLLNALMKHYKLTRKQVEKIAKNGE